MTEEPTRPDPDALLQRVNADAERERRAKLKIFFGFAPGVGKTYRMLQVARELAVQDVDVVVGVVETHGRYDTAALVLGLELLPLRRIPYRGRTLEELDLDAALARHPKVVLVDELAHSNPTGSRHAKRWQDVLELLDAGIDVHTTLNVQHVESLNDVVEQITSIQVRETVPDAILDRAGEIELVDLEPEELLARLREGKVYLPDQAARAAQHFFKRGNLLALRELALRRTADRVDADVQAYREANAIRATWPAGERLVVGIGPAPTSAKLLRAARRQAAGLRAPWAAVYVERSGAPPLSVVDAERLEQHLRLAESMGGEVVRLVGPDLCRALLDYARLRNVTRIVLGQPARVRLRDRLRGSLVDAVVRSSGDIDVQIIAGDDESRVATTSTPAGMSTREGARGWPGRASFEQAGLAGADARRSARLGAEPSTGSLHGALSSVLLVALATGLGWLGRGVLALPDLVMLYLVAIMLSAVRFGRRPSWMASAFAVVAYDFFFVPPVFTLSVSDLRHVLTFVMMFLVGGVISGLTDRLRRQERRARDREARTGALYALSRELAGALDETQVARVLARHAAEAIALPVAIIVPTVGRETTGDELVVAARSQELELGAAELAVVRWVLDHGRPAGMHTDTLPGAKVAVLPLRSGPRVVGALAIVTGSAGRLDREATELLDTFNHQAALAIERARLADEAKLAALRVRDEEMRSSLLSAVSHDLRTPLATITGAATTLRDDASAVSEAQRLDLLEAICEESERMERLIANLLDMTRLDSGGLVPKREWVPVEELVGSALQRLEDKLGDRMVTVELQAAPALLSVDPILIEQLLVNLLDNALKYTPPGSPLDVTAHSRPGSLVLEVADRGPGLDAAAAAHIFEKFYRGAHAGVGGVGLGLPICKGIAEVHGGTIEAQPRPAGGTTFRVTLPQTATPPEIHRDELRSVSQPRPAVTAASLTGGAP